MATLSSEKLTQLLRGALPDATQEPSPNSPKPTVLNIPDMGRVRVYLWTTTPDASAQGRPEGEHKIQIIIPGTVRNSRQVFDHGDMPTFIMGYSPVYGVFAFWQIACHPDAAYSANFQVSAQLLEEASLTGWAIDRPRRTQRGPEVRAAVHPSHLKRFLQLSIEADGAGRSGEPREAFLLAGAPDLDGLDLRKKITEGEPVALLDVERARVEASGTRLKRDSKFSNQVLSAFAHKCAVCEAQLSILEGAHIIPVHDPKGSDEVWNGLCLCRNHHRLFDRKILLIDPGAVVRADQETLDVLRDLNRLGGYDDLIGNYRNSRLRCLPGSYGVDGEFTRKMTAALEYRYGQAPAR
ncbi:MAG: HNH endonuclease [Hyphomicrobiaceae bacterium]